MAKHALVIHLGEHDAGWRNHRLQPIGLWKKARPINIAEPAENRSNRPRRLGSVSVAFGARGLDHSEQAIPLSKQIDPAGGRYSENRNARRLTCSVAGTRG